MRTRPLITIAAFGAHLTPARADCIGGSDPEEIIRQLTAAPYSRLVRPGNAGPPTEVATQLYLESLNTVDEIGNAVDVSGYWRMSWTDQRMNFTSVGDGGCFDEVYLHLQGSGGSVPLTSPDAWVPDLYFSSALSESYGSNFFAVYPTGSVYVSVRFRHIFKCVKDFTHMPFDTQTCTIEIMSYTEDASKVELAAKDGLGLVLPEAGASLPAWRIKKTDQRIDLLQYGTGDNAMYWHSLKLDVILERASGYYIMNDVLYGVLFVAMSWTGFFVARTNAPARVALSLLPVLTMLNHIRGVQSQLPRVSEMTWLSSFLLMSLMYNIIAVLEFGLVSYMLSREDGRAERLRVLRALSSLLDMAYDAQRTEQLSSKNLQPADEPTAARVYASVPTATATTTATTTAAAAAAVEVELEEGLPPMNVCHSLSSGLNLSNLLPVQQRVVHDAMKLFDDGDGIVHPAEMRRGLRYFNIYYTAEQVTEIFAKMGVSGGEGMHTSKFLKYLSSMREPTSRSSATLQKGVSDQPPSMEPSPTLQKGFADHPPSMQLEIVMRFGFMSSYLLVLAILMPVAASI